MRRMAATVQHRGPDDSGEYLSEELQLAVVRLAIIDPKGGHQPVYGCTDGLVCAYNGEIYDQYPLRKMLSAEGHRIESECDTALLPHCYEQWGSDFVTRIRGMFALALWDRPNRTLLLARDRLGIKPLYYAETRDFLVFGSEIKAILASDLVDRSLDYASVSDLFSFSYPCSPRTMFRSIREVRPGHTVTVAAGSPAKSHRYWRAPFAERGSHQRISFSDAKLELTRLLERTVYDHLVSDVPVATYLSGGIDSSLIAALVKKVTGDAPPTFSIGFDTPAHDESEDASAVASFLGSVHRTVRCTKDAAEHYPSAIWNTELPLQFPLALPLQLLSSAVRAQGFPVVLTGEGPDELLGGYDCFRADKLRRLLDSRATRWLRKPIYRQLYHWLGSPAGAAERMADGHRDAARVQAKFHGLYPPWFDVWKTLEYQRSELLAPIRAELRAIDQPPFELSDLMRDNVSRLHPLDAALSFEIETRLPSWILTIGDRASMANGVEARVPFLDHKIVEFLTQLPPSLKLRGLTEKSLLRAIGRDLLPAETCKKRKRPFYTPIREWFFSNDPPAYVAEMMSPHAIRNAGIFSPEVVQTLMRQISKVPDRSVLLLQHEWILVLVLGTQLLHYQFVDRLKDNLDHRLSPNVRDLARAAPV